MSGSSCAQGRHWLCLYEVDIKPKGFRVVEFDGFINERALERVRHLRMHPEQTRAEVEANYQLAKRYFSYVVLERRVQLMLADCLGEPA